MNRVPTFPKDLSPYTNAQHYTDRHYRWLYSSDGRHVCR